jgi:ligand-binding SRPBCC domain-containing protein
MEIFERTFVVRAPLTEVWAFHSEPAALTKITPGAIRVEIQSCDYPVRNGSKIAMRMHAGPVSVQWNSLIVGHLEFERFTDEQINGEGPFKVWNHTHSFAAVQDGTRVTDHVEYEMPFGVFGKVAHTLGGRFMIMEMFNARMRATKACLEGRSRQISGIGLA